MALGMSCGLKFPPRRSHEVRITQYYGRILAKLYINILELVNSHFTSTSQNLTTCQNLNHTSNELGGLLQYKVLAIAAAVWEGSPVAE